MSNKDLINFKKTKFFDGISWIIEGMRIFLKKPLPLLIVSLPFLFGFTGIMWINIQGVYTASGALLATFVLSLIFPLSVQAITVSYKQFEDNQEVRLSKSYNQVFSLNGLRLILVYVLLVLFCSFGSNYFFSLVQSESVIINYVFQSVFIVLQFIILLAIPLNVYSKKRIRPFRILFLSLIGLIRNFIPCLTVIISAFILLILAILLAKYLAIVAGKGAIVFYLLELWLFVTWLGTTAIAMFKAIYTQID
ncbi:MAG: hypothetical protein E6Q33_05095 [Neisseriales bacterium]|nr:MAG: hypothetical protein E6Q33_05095 [Neisseriales bacterium]